MSQTEQGGPGPLREDQVRITLEKGPYAEHETYVVAARDCEVVRERSRAPGQQGQFRVAIRAWAGCQSYESFDPGPPPPQVPLVPQCGDVHVERALELPPGTLGKWRATLAAGQALAPEDAALLRLLQRFPWLVDVADAGYDRASAGQAVVVEVLKLAARNAEPRSSGLAGSDMGEAER